MNEILSVEHLKAKYPRIGHGEFGDVYLIEDKVIKIIKSLKLEELEVYRKKINLLTKIKEENYIFPEYFINFNDESILAYMMPYVMKNNRFESLYDMFYCNIFDSTKTIFLSKCLDAIKRLHQRDIAIGDLNPNNILVDIDLNPQFIDTDGYDIGNLGIEPRINTYFNYRNRFKGTGSNIDMDKFSFTILILSSLIGTTLINKCNSLKSFDVLIDNLDLSDDAKHNLHLIINDYHNKPYPDIILKEAQDKRRILKKNPSEIISLL